MEYSVSISTIMSTVKTFILIIFITQTLLKTLIIVVASLFPWLGDRENLELIVDDFERGMEFHDNMMRRYDNNNYFYN